MPYSSQVSNLQTRITTTGATVTVGELDALDALIVGLTSAGLLSKVLELHIPVGSNLTAAAHRLIYATVPAATLPGGSTWSTSTGLAASGAISSEIETGDVAPDNFHYGAAISNAPWSSGGSITGAQDDADPYNYNWGGTTADKVVGNTILYAGRTPAPGDSWLPNAGNDGHLLISGLSAENFVLRDGEVLAWRAAAWRSTWVTGGQAFQLPKRSATLHCSHVGTKLTLAQARTLSDLLRTCCAALSAGRAIPAARANRIVWEGDSLTYGTRVSGLPYAEPIYKQFADAKGFTAANAEQFMRGVPGQQLAAILAGTAVGDVTKEELDLWHRVGIPRAKRIHIVWMNTNDCLVGTSGAAMKANLDTRVAQIKAAGGIPIVIGLVIRINISGSNDAGWESRAAAYHAAVAADTDYISAPTLWDGTKKAYWVPLHTITALQNGGDTSGGSATRYVDGVNTTVHLTEAGYGHIIAPLTAAYDAAVTPILPAITSANNASGERMSPFSFSVTASGGATSFSLTGSLPSGVTFNTSTGELSGTPTVAGTFPVSITASNSDGSSAPQSFTLTITPALISMERYDDYRNWVTATGRFLFIPTDDPGNPLDLGDITLTRLAFNPQEVKTFKNRGGKRTLINARTTEISPEFEVTIGEENRHTLPVRLFAEQLADADQAAATAATSTFNNVRHGTTVWLRKVNVSNVVVKVGVTVKTLGTDYDVDLKLGLVRILEGGSIVSGTDDIIVEYDVPAQGYAQYKTFTRLNRSGRGVLFIEDEYSDAPRGIHEFDVNMAASDAGEVSAQKATEWKVKLSILGNATYKARQLTT